jgi:hypothetical protein
MFEHMAMRIACAKKRDELRGYFQSSPPPSAGPDFDRRKHLHAVTATFVDMLQHRHTADYDGSKVWSRVEVWERIDAVAEAFASWKAIQDHHEAQDFLVTLLLRERKG